MTLEQAMAEIEKTHTEKCSITKKPSIIFFPPFFEQVYGVKVEDVIEDALKLMRM